MLSDTRVDRSVDHVVAHDEESRASSAWYHFGMSTHPETPRKRSFRFGLRWMLIAVAVCAVGLTIGSQWLVVHRRHSALDTLRSDPRILDVSMESDYLYGAERLNDRGFSMSTVRRWLGDQGVLSVTIAGEPTPEEQERIKDAFPEAVVKAGPQAGIGVF